MANLFPKPNPEEPDLSTQSDFRLLSDFADFVSRERSRELKAIAWEIMRRYTASLAAHAPKGQKDRGSILGETRWGDAKRVEAVFGIRRGVLRRLLIE